MPGKNLLFILNPISGTTSKESIKEQINIILKDDFEVTIVFTEYAGHGAEIAEKRKDQYNGIVAVGGDGTINEIASKLIDSECALGIVPKGSGNGLARHLKIPRDVGRAVERIKLFNPSRYDTGTVNDHFFAGTCGFGFDAHIAHLFSKAPKRGFVQYAKLVASEYTSYQPQLYTIEMGNTTIEKKALLCSVANISQFGNGFTISPESDNTDGKMELVFIEKMPVAASPFTGTRFFTQTIENSRYFEKHTFEKELRLTINQGSSGVYHVDGEPFIGTGDFLIKIHHQNLLIL